MQFLVVFLALVGYATCADSPKHSCYDSAVDACSAHGADNADLPNCNSKYGAIDEIATDLQKYANSHIAHSFDYLLMSTHFGNYQKDRLGFEKLFRKLSDKTWDDAIDLIKYITKRGGSMDFTARSVPDTVKKTYEANELESLGRALDAQKSLATEAQRIHREVTRQREQFHDPEVGSFIENHFVHKHAESIRELSGHGNDLKRLLVEGNQASLALFLFDEYLQKE